MGIRTLDVEMGDVLYENGNRFVCKNGIWDKKNTILWDDIESLTIRGTKQTFILIPMNEFIDLTIHTKQGKSITLQLGSIGVINKSTKEKFSDAYAFIVSNIIERQLNEFSESLRCGKKADFGSFEISPEAFYRKKLFGGYDIIPLSKLLRCHIENGEFFVLYHDGENKCKRKKCGFVYEIINLHVVQAFMSAIERQKTSAWVLYKQRYTSSDGS